MGAQPVTVLAPYAPVGTGMLAPFQQVRSLGSSALSALSVVPAGGAQSIGVFRGGQTDYAR